MSSFPNTEKVAQTEFAVTIIGSTGTVIMDNDDVRHLYFIEDIYSYCMTGKLYCRDTRALSQMLPLVGSEEIIVIYESKDGRLVEITFSVIKMEKVENTQEKHRHLFELTFILKEHKGFHMPHHSTSWMCELYTDYVRHICDFHVGITDWCDWEDGNEELHYYNTQLKTPATCIEWLGNRTSGSISGQPGYLLFSSTEDPGAPYHFVTLEKLLSMAPLLDPRPWPEYYTIQSHYDYYINRILSYDVSRVDKRALEKLMYWINVGYDMKRKKYLRNEYVYKDALDRFTCLGLKSLFNEAESPISCFEEYTAEVEEKYIMKNLYFGDWIKRYCLQQLVTINIEGHSDRHCGKMIEILWPTSTTEEEFDQNMDGYYLVKSITHYFSPLQKPVYTQKMVLIKNAYNVSSGNLTDAGKVRISIPGPHRKKAEADTLMYDF